MRAPLPVVPLLVLMARMLPQATALEKGVIYVQPSYHYTNTLDLDLEVTPSTPRMQAANACMHSLHHSRPAAAAAADAAADADADDDATVTATAISCFHVLWPVHALPSCSVASAYSPSKLVHGIACTREQS
jgi:hypothetical protein